MTVRTATCARRPRRETRHRRRDVAATGRVRSAPEIVYSPHVRTCHVVYASYSRSSYPSKTREPAMHCMHRSRRGAEFPRPSYRTGDTLIDFHSTQSRTCSPPTGRCVQTATGSAPSLPAKGSAHDVPPWACCCLACQSIVRVGVVSWGKATAHRDARWLRRAAFDSPLASSRARPSQPKTKEPALPRALKRWRCDDASSEACIDTALPGRCSGSL